MQTKTIVVLSFLFLLVLVGFLLHALYRNFARNQSRLAFATSQPLIFDVRTAQEFSGWHFPTAQNVETPTPPLSANDLQSLRARFESTLTDTPQQYPILVYCKKGVRAAKALRVLNDIGYDNVISLGGVDTEPLKSLIQQ